MSNGKGSRPRNNHSEAFRVNFEAIFGPFRPKTQAGASKRLKTQGNAISEAFTGECLGDLDTDDPVSHGMEWCWYWETPTQMRIHGCVVVREWLTVYKGAEGQKTALTLLPIIKQKIAKKLNCSVEQIDDRQIETDTNKEAK